MSQQSIGPAGKYLLISAGTDLAEVDIATGQYTKLPGTMPAIEVSPKFPPVLGKGVDVFSW
jgi:hypothetical protein